MDLIKINELADQYGFTVQYFPTTETLFVYGMCDNWKIKYIPNRKRQYILYHENKLYQYGKYHKQGEKVRLEHCFDSIYTHKQLYSLLHTVKSLPLKH